MTQFTFTVAEMLQRAFDFLAATLGLVLLSPLLAVLAFAVKITSKGPIFYGALRVGQHGRTFHALKFRSMVPGADKLGPGITTAGDPRITPVGQFVRHTKLDELPQLVNVIKGEMSLVGPRPEDPRYVALYTPEQRQVLSVRPGITSPASVQFRNEAETLKGPEWETVYINEIMPQKLQIELDYLKRRTLLTDLGLIWRTVRGTE